MINLEQFPNYTHEYVNKWIAKYCNSGNEMPKESDLRAVADWLSSLPEENPKMMNKLYKLNWSSVMSHQEKWHEQMAKRSEKVKQFIGNPNDIKVIKELPNGMKWVEILTPEGKDYEGDAMGHCVGKGSYDNAIIYSLRDKNNLPHCTIDYTFNKFPYSGPGIPQVQGRANSAIVDKYHDIIKDFIINDLKVPPENIYEPEKFGYSSFKFQNNPEVMPQEFLKIKDVLNIIDNKPIYNHILNLNGNIDYIPPRLGENTLLNITDAYLPQQVNINAFKPIFLNKVENMKELQITASDFTISEIPDLETCNINKISKNIDIENIDFEKISIYSLPALQKLSISDTEPCSISSLSLSRLPNLEQIDGNIKEITSLFIDSLPKFKKFNQNIICYEASFLKSNIEDISNITFKGNADFKNCQNLTNLYHKEWTFNLSLYNCGIQKIESDSCFDNLELIDNVEEIGDNVTINGNFYYRVRDQNKSIKIIGDNFQCKYSVVLDNTQLEHIGSNLNIKGFLSLNNSKLSELKDAKMNSLLAEDSSLKIIENVEVNNIVKLTNSAYLEKIPDNWVINSLEISNCYALLEMPNNLTVNGTLNAVNCFSILNTGENLKVNGNAYFLECESLQEITDGTYIQGSLNLYGCSDLVRIGNSVKVNDLILTGCHKLKELPDDLEVKMIILPDGEPCNSLQVAKKWFEEKRFPQKNKKNEMAL